MAEQMIDDLFVFQLIREGDRRAFRRVFDEWFVPLCRFVRVYVREERMAEEVVIDTFTALWEKRESLQIELTLKAYLFQSARNRTLNYLRDNARYVSVADWTVFERCESDYSLELAELEELIREAVCSLPARGREIFTLSRYENLSNKEIAERLNVSVKNVEAQITKSLKKIKQYLGDAYYYLW